MTYEEIRACMDESDEEVSLVDSWLIMLCFIICFTLLNHVQSMFLLSSFMDWVILSNFDQKNYLIFEYLFSCVMYKCIKCLKRVFSLEPVDNYRYNNYS